MQLFVYLTALTRLPIADILGVDTVSPAGVFYVSLRGYYPAAKTRDEALADAADAKRAAYRHRGRFVDSLLDAFDCHGRSRGTADQFHFKLKKDGGFYANCADPLSSAAFRDLLESIERRLVEMGEAIFAGDISLNPYRHRNKTACERCDYAAVCRVDPWTHTFRSLTVASAPEE